MKHMKDYIFLPGQGRLFRVKGHVKIIFSPRNSPLISLLLPQTGTDFA